MNIVERFHDSYIPVPESGCWLWEKAIYGRGYGYFFLTKKGGPRHTKAHRYSWELHNNPIPDGLHVLHKCDNRLCVNPAHLYIGTNDDNIKDRMDRGPKTGTPGEKHPKAKLTENDVINIRELLKTIPAKDIANKFHVSRCTIYSIKHGRSWKCA